MVQVSSTTATTAGNIGSVLLLLLTTIITGCMLFQYPSSSVFDEHWLSHGFCVSNASSHWKNSHALSFYADTAFALVIAYLYSTQPKMGANAPPPLQIAMVKGAITGVLGHGLGHLYLSLQAEGTDLRLRLTPDLLMTSLASTLVVVLGFSTIFQGTMPLCSPVRKGLVAIVATAGFTLLDVVPKFNFIYGQAVIYISSALHLLSLDAEHKSTTVYLLYPYFQLPVLAIGVLESTACQSVLQPIGGHALFDSAIALGYILLQLLPRWIRVVPLEKSKRL